MADAATECKTTTDFHPCDTPRGMNYYKLTDLDTLQQTILNRHKLQTIRENQKYLKNHPEVGVAVKLVLDEVLKSRPLRKIPEFITEYFVMNSEEIKEKMSAAIEKRKEEEKEQEEEKRKLSEIASKKSSVYSRHSAYGDQIDMDQMTLDYLAYQAAACEGEEGEFEFLDRSGDDDLMLMCYEIVEELVANVAKREIPSCENLPYTDSDPMLDMSSYTMENFDEKYYSASIL